MTLQEQIAERALSAYHSGSARGGNVAGWMAVAAEFVRCMEWARRIGAEGAIGTRTVPLTLPPNDWKA